jgi:hypothetical protein
MIGNCITFSAFGYAALCTIIMLFVHGATKLPELLSEDWKPHVTSSSCAMKAPPSP